MRGRSWQLITGAVTCAGVVAGAFAAPAVAAVALFAVPLVALGVAFAIASGRANQDFWIAYAASLGMTYVGETTLPETTPILGEGDRRSCKDWMHGTTAGGQAVGLGNYTYQTREQDSDRKGYHYVDHDYSLATLQVAPADRAFVRAVSVRTHHRNKLTRFFGKDSVDELSMENLPTESAVFNDRYDLMVEEQGDHVRVLEVFAPTFLARLAEHPLCPFLDYRSGLLVVFVEDHSDEATEFTALLECVQEIGRRFSEEIAETVRAGESPAPR